MRSLLRGFPFPASFSVQRLAVFGSARRGVPSSERETRRHYSQVAGTLLHARKVISAGALARVTRRRIAPCVFFVTLCFSLSTERNTRSRDSLRMQGRKTREDESRGCDEMSELLVDNGLLRCTTVSHCSPEEYRLKYGCQHSINSAASNL